MSRTKLRSTGIPVNGMLLLDKPSGLTSSQVVQSVKKLMNARKVGHTGTLDPIATGLLLLCFGEATKISEMFLHASKCYKTQIQLGITTDTGDREGQVQSQSSANVSEQQLAKALDLFRGEFEQIPPMYSALKRNGEPLYKLARKGITVVRKPRKVTVSELSVRQWSGTNLELDVCCTSGFYVRTLATDLGEALGCGAHVRELQRTAVGNFSVANTITMADIEAYDTPRERRTLLLPIDKVLDYLPAVNLPDNLAYYLKRMKQVRVAGLPDQGLVRVYSGDAKFLGLAEVTEDGKIAPKQLFDTA